MNAQDRRQRDMPRRREDAAADLLMSLFRAAPVAIVGETVEGRILTWNRAAEQIFGYAAHEAIGESSSMLVPPERADEARSMRERARQGHATAGLETVRLRRDGTPVALVLDMALVPGPPDQDGLLCQIAHLLPVERREARAPPAPTEHLLRALAASGAGTFRFDVKTDECEYDQTFARLWELPSDRTADAQAVLSRIHPDDLMPVRAALDRSTREGTDFELEHRVNLLSGEARWLLSKGKTFTDAEGRLCYMTGVSVDITHRRRAEEALRQSEERFRGLAEAIPSIVWESDRDGRSLYKNRVWFDYTGQGVARGSQEDWRQFYHPDDRERLRPPSVDHRRPEPFDIEARIRRHDGAYRWFRVRGAPILDDSGTIVRWAGTCTDVDDQKRAAQALEEADRHKNEFLAMLAHELRNPLASIRNAAEIVRMSAGGNERLRYAIEVIGRQTERLGRLIADLLDLSNISRGKLALQREPCDLLTVVREAVDLTRGAIERKRQELELQLPEPRMVLLGDPARLVQLVSNLVDNAMKYTPERGRIEVAVRREGELAVLDVRDNGMGIPPELLPNVFDLFVQGERPSGRAAGGLGIGLALVKEIAAMHGGRVSADSLGPGAGSQFSVTLPLSQDESPEAQPDPGARRSTQAHARRVLIVDDNRDYADSLAMLLQHLGHQTLTLYTSAEALARAPAFAPDVALVDIGLPGMSGAELGRRLRDDPRLAHTVLVAISGFGQDVDGVRAPQAAFAHYLLKPVRLDELLPMIESADREAGNG